MEATEPDGSAHSSHVQPIDEEVSYPNHCPTY